MFVPDSPLPPKYDRLSIPDRLRSYLVAAHRHAAERRSVHELQDLDDRLLRDINLTREEALRTKPRPFQQFVV